MVRGLVGVGVGILVTGCKPPAPPPPKRPPSPVTVVPAQSQDVPVYVDEIGKTSASELVNIQPQVTGQIVKRHFVDGADLKTGDPLFEIDPQMFQATVQQAEANLESAKAQVELAEAEFHRYEAAYKVKAASREDYDAKKAAVATTTAQVKVTQAALDTAKLNLSYARIYSPINGRAGQRLVDVGNIVKANETNMLGIQRVSPIYADFTITEANLPQVRDEMAAGTLHALVSLKDFDHDYPDVKRVPGKLTFLDNTVQQNAGRILLRATLPNEDRYFWPGQFVYVRLVVSTLKDAVLIPFQCTQQGQQGAFVYVVKDDSTVEQRQVGLGQRQFREGQDMVVIAKGLKKGERVVLTGQIAIGPGAHVRVISPATQPEAAASQSETAPATAPGTLPSGSAR
jgi:multidrug efflux system membrane fusion protein